MKKHLLAFSILFAFGATAQINAITETGDLVFLFDDGSWQYADSSSLNGNEEIPINPVPFFKPATSKFLLKSNITPYGFWLNPKEWSFSKKANNEDAEYELNHKEKDLYGVIITERIGMPIQTLRSIAIENAREVVMNLKVVEDEFRQVNGIEILYMRMQGNIQGIQIEYRNYYYSIEGGTVQYITFSSLDLMEEYAQDSEQLLNGLVLLQAEEE